MNWEAIGAIGEILGAMGVIVTLIYLASQLRQNTAMMKAESRNAIHHGNQQELFTIVANPEIWKGFTGLDANNETIRLLIWLSASMRAREHEWFQFRSGALDESVWNSQANVIPVILALERSRAWWDAVKPIFDRSFTQEVDRILTTRKFDGTHSAQLSPFSSEASGPEQ